MLKNINLFQDRIPLLLIFLFIIQGIISVLMYPLWEGYDEPAHFGYIQYIAENWKLPSTNDNISNEVQSMMDKIPVNVHMKDRGKYYPDFWSTFDIEKYTTDRKIIFEIPISERTNYSKPWRIWEAQLPPIAHLTQVPVYLMFYDHDIIDRAYALRIFSVLVTAIAIFIGYKTISLIFNDQFMRIGSTIFMVFNPMFTNNISRVNNEAITILLFSLFLYLIVRYIKEKPNLKLVLAISVVTSIGLLSKPTFVSAVLVIPIVLFLKQIQKNEEIKISVKTNLKNFGIIISVIVPLVSWWYFERFVTGNFSGITILQQLTLEEYISGFTLIDWSLYYWTFFQSFWGAFGWTFYLPPFPYFEVLKGISIISMVGLFLGLTRKIKKEKLNTFGNPKYQSIIVISLSIIFIILAQSFVSIQLYYITGGGLVNGWYLFVTMTGISLLLLLGFKMLMNIIIPKSIQRFTLIFVYVIMIGYNSSIFFYLLPKYYLGV